jgi:hypothetical protein
MFFPNIYIKSLIYFDYILGKLKVDMCILSCHWFENRKNSKFIYLKLIL